MVDHRLTTPRTLSVHAGSQASPTLGVGFSATQPLLGHVFRARAEVWAGTHPSPLERCEAWGLLAGDVLVAGLERLLVVNGRGHRPPGY